MTITALPTAPSTSDPSTFAARADALIAALSTFVSEANALAVAMNLNSTTDTSVTSNAIGTGSKTFTVTAGKSFQPGMYLVIADVAAASTNSMYVQVTSYSGTTLIVNSISIFGSGTKTSWVISQSAATNLSGKASIWIPAGAMVSRQTNGALVGLAETSTNKIMLRTLNFDSSTQQYAQFSLKMPKSWDIGTLTSTFVWSHPSTTVNFGVAWQLRAVALSNDDALDAAFGTAVTVTDTGGTTDDLYHSDESIALTVGGTPASMDTVIFQVDRDPANGSDNLAVAARLHGILLNYTNNTFSDV